MLSTFFLSLQAAIDPTTASLLLNSFAKDADIMARLSAIMMADAKNLETISSLRKLFAADDAVHLGADGERVFEYFATVGADTFANVPKLMEAIQKGAITDSKLISELMTNRVLQQKLLNAKDPTQFNKLWEDYKLSGKTDGFEKFIQSSNLVLWKTADEMNAAVTDWAKKTMEALPSKTQKGYFNTATAVYDTRTGKYYFGRNGGIVDKTTEIVPELADKLPLKSTNEYKLGNCAECDAVNKALIDNAKWEDLQIHTVSVRPDGSISFKPQCTNCQPTFKGMKTTSE